MTARRRISLLTMFTLAAAGVACGGDDPTGNSGPPLSGTYVLTSVDDELLPVAVSGNSAVTGGRLEFVAPDQVQRVTTTFTAGLSGGSTSTEVLLGHYTRSGSTMILRYDASSSGGAFADTAVIGTGLVAEGLLEVRALVAPLAVRRTYAYVKQ